MENDDRLFGVSAAVGVAGRTGIPVIWYVLQHHCHDPDRMPDAEALALALDTWPQGVVPKIHSSSPRLDVELRKRKDGRRTVERPWLPPLRAHADLLDPLAFEAFLTRDTRGRDFDVMLEAKAKDLALRRLRDQLTDRELPWINGHVVVR